ncbi:VCBS repeat-containing protein [Mucilaginibacter flavidus]|uniref:VCBS repeat-containing protein n=1 Tax=Mucilaginibacter flavidus TaxID=2949309 RepID=UPI0020925174|nr:VCBS repeat-containing protein [Mucilaginibacter flavidus]MCO5945739.1 VCBS repeat-containing protein [Mucilaginibacter flavidus]
MKRLKNKADFIFLEKKIRYGVYNMRYCFIFFLFALTSCQKKQSGDNNKLFELLNPKETHIDFVNQLSYDADFNIFTYRNFYNGGGVAIGDINNDGLPDIFLVGNMVPSRLYLNKGNFQFEDITEKAGIAKLGKWSTGVTMADVNGDGLLDIYVCNSGDVKGDHKQNELYINNGNLTFTEKAKEYGIGVNGYSTHAVFFDYDHDGDLDLFILSNSFKAIGSFNLQSNERNIRDPLGGQKLFRNDGGHFTDVSKQAGIYGSVIGFGLGVSVGDVDGDGWDDIYVSNDFFERDYLYINNHDGTFKESLEDQMKSISNASMGADLADINNDAHPDIFATDMLPENEARVKINTTFENWDKYQLDLRYDYYHQFTRNTLQLNNGNGTFSEIGRLAGVHATDWSWGALITDMDNDGLKDIFIANGIYKDLTNQDYIQHLSNRDVMGSVWTSKGMNYKKLIDSMPSEAIPNYAYRNNGDLTFTNKAAEWGLDQPGFSNGSAYGDLNNDGALDMVVNNVNMPAFIYRNNSRKQHPENKYLKVMLQGEGKNRFGVGAQVTLYYNHTLSYQEQMPSRGFESSVDNRLNFGLGKTKEIDSIVVKWPGGKQKILKGIKPNQSITVKESESMLPKKAASEPAPVKPLFEQSAENHGIDFEHKENDFVDFDREKLIFQMHSTDGPRIAKGDVNGDGLEDFYICGAKDQPGALYIQTPTGRFKRSNEKLFDQDKASEDTDCLFFDADGDGDQDLYVCSGGNEFSANSTELIDRLYINDGKGHFTKSSQVLPSYQFESSSCVTAADFDGDGDQDLFVGVRLKPGKYGYPCKGYILQNDGKGIFTDVTDKVAPGLKELGMVTDAKWFDYDHDGKPDLVVCGEYMPIRIFHNEGGHLKEVTREAGMEWSNGWWNRLEIADIDGDGYPDIVAGNHGLNSRFKATRQKPVSMYVGDFSRTGDIEQIVCTYNGDKQYPMVLRHDLVGELPYLKKKYLRYAQYKEQTMEDIFGTDLLQKMDKLDAYELRSSVLMNNRNGTFTMKPLPVEAQFSTVFALVVKDYDGDGKADILLGGNFYQSKPEAGIYDASYGLLLKGDGKGSFTAIKPQTSGIVIKGAVRDMKEIKAGKNKLLIVAKNNDKTEILVKAPGKK